MKEEVGGGVGRGGGVEDGPADEEAEAEVERLEVVKHALRRQAHAVRELALAEALAARLRHHLEERVLVRGHRGGLLLSEVQCGGAQRGRGDDAKRIERGQSGKRAERVARNRLALVRKETPDAVLLYGRWLTQMS